MKASGVITSNDTGENVIPVGSTWSFELVYDTVALDQDSNVDHGSYDAAMAVRYFHYQAGGYEMTLNDSTPFLPGSALLVSSSGIDSMDINLGSASIPQLGGKEVSFHADFNNFAGQDIFPTDALPANTALDLNSFQDGSVTLGVEGVPGGGAIIGSLSQMTELSFSAVPEVSTSRLAAVATALYCLFGGQRRRFAGIVRRD